MSPRTRAVLLAVALLTLAGVGTISVRETRAQLAAIEACEAVDRGDTARALALTEARTGPGRTGRLTAECRCRALRSAGREDDCIALLGEIAAGAPDWTPAADLAPGAARALVEAGRAPEAAALVQRVRQQQPGDLGLLVLELDLRAGFEPEAQVIEDLAGHLPGEGDLAALGRAALAKRQLRRGDPPAALAVLGSEAPTASAGALSHWYDTKLTAHALDDDLVATRRAREAWLRAGHDPAIVRARYALALSIAGLEDPRTPMIPLLQQALDETADHDERKLREGLAIRLILTLASSRRLDEALAAFDTHQPALGLEGLTRAELLRAARREQLATAAPEARIGVLRFRVPKAPEGSELWLSPDAALPADASYQRLALPPSGEVSARRSEGEVPQRWVLRRDQEVWASGTVSPLAGQTRTVQIEPTGPRAPDPTYTRARRGADGRRRVALVLLDCGDWRIVRYLRARGELPVLAALLRDGHRALLKSDPPLTAAALESLVWPGRRSGASVLGLVHRMGVELAGLASVGDNPFDALRFVLPESDDLFSVVGAGERSAANLLLSHGGIRAGRHGEVTGPHGRRSRVPIGRAKRDLDPEERRRWPALASPPKERDALYIRTIAAELDATTELARAGAHDFMAVRIEPLDILTHANYADTAADGQDDGAKLLYSVYRYIDARLAEVDAALDEDDVLIVMSDHGIRTAMEHSPDAFFVAVGAGVPTGRAPGQPDLRGVPKALALLLDVATEWPDNDIAAFARRTLAARGPSDEASAVR